MNIGYIPKKTKKTKKGTTIVEKADLIEVSMTKKELDKVQDKSGEIVENWQDKVDKSRPTGKLYPPKPIIGKTKNATKKEVKEVDDAVKDLIYKVAKKSGLLKLIKKIPFLEYKKWIKDRIKKEVI